MILALPFGALHAWGHGGLAFEWCGPNLYFLRHSSKVPDFHSKNPMTCHLSFAVKIRHRYALGNMDCDNHIEKGEQVYIYTYIMHNASS